MTTEPAEHADELMLALEILAADGMNPRKAAPLVVAAERKGRNPVAFARHLIRVRNNVKGRARR